MTDQPGLSSTLSDSVGSTGRTVAVPQTTPVSLQRSVNDDPSTAVTSLSGAGMADVSAISGITSASAPPLSIPSPGSIEEIAADVSAKLSAESIPTPAAEPVAVSTPEPAAVEPMVVATEVEASPGAPLTVTVDGTVVEPTPASVSSDTDSATTVAGAESSAIPTPPSFNSSVGNPVKPPQSVVGALMEQGKISAEQYQALLIEQANTGKTVEALVEEKQLVKELDLTKAKADFYAIEYITLADTGASPEAISLIPESVARRYQMLPFTLDKANRQLSVAMKNPLDLSAIDFVEKKTGYHLVPYFATPSEIERMIAERYAQSLSSEVNAALKETAQEKASNTRQADNANSVFSREVVREAPITKIVETVLGFAVKSRASDVHIEPQEDRTRVRYRIDGILTEKLILPRTVHEAVISRIKILADMKIDEKRIPQDGRFSFMSEGQEVDLRVSSLPTTFGEKIVMRLLKKNATVPTLADLGLRDLALKNVEEAIKIPHGIVLVTGPTGSGKTTTLYSILHNINTPKVNIVTLEDPVEYQMQGVNQVQVNTQVGLTFASGLRSFLRQDPNIIMVGEIRDTETAALAVQASLTGHLVFSTLHTNSAAGALPRLIDMEVEPFLLASSLTLVIGQRVARKLNDEYKEEYEPAKEVAEDIKTVLGPLYTQWCTKNQKDPDQLRLYRARADRPEDELEYSGRVAIFEVLRMTDEVSRMVIEQKASKEIEEVAVEKNGMLLMKQDGYIKALDGITTIEEVLRVAEV